MPDIEHILPVPAEMNRIDDRLDQGTPNGLFRESTVIRTLIGKVVRCSVEYVTPVEAKISDYHQDKLNKYARHFCESRVFTWVPDGENKIGVFKVRKSRKWGLKRYIKEITLTNGIEADIAFGAKWREQHIHIARISWKISKEEYLNALSGREIPHDVIN